MNHEQNEAIIGLLLDHIKHLKEELRYEKNQSDFYINQCRYMSEQIEKLTPKRGRPAKKRGPGRPRKSVK
jgi:hypothetical protein